VYTRGKKSDGSREEKGFIFLSLSQTEGEEEEEEEEEHTERERDMCVCIRELLRPSSRAYF